MPRPRPQQGGGGGGWWGGGLGGVWVVVVVVGGGVICVLSRGCSGLFGIFLFFPPASLIFSGVLLPITAKRYRDSWGCMHIVLTEDDAASEDEF